MPKRYIVMKWWVYGAATMLLLLLDLFLFHKLSYRHVTPFLLPMLLGVVASLEGSVSAPIFGLVLGVLWDLGSQTPAPGFFTFTAALATLLTALFAQRFLSPGFLSAFVSATMCYLVVALGRMTTLEPSMLQSAAAVAGMEYAMSLPLLAVVYPVYRWVHKKTTIAY